MSKAEVLKRLENIAKHYKAGALTDADLIRCNAEVIGEYERTLLANMKEW